MARVFVATETALGRKVVLKVLPPEMAGAVSIQRFMREIRVAAQLQHPHVVPLLSAGEAAGVPWYSMPFVAGESLRARLEHQGELPIGAIVPTLREIASALAHAHARGVVHRDIKPENILLSDGAAFVSDFGVAKAIADAGEASLTSQGMALGTPAYMSPEQGTADPRTDHRADVYAFGVVAYEMLVGHTPFAGRSAQATLAAHVNEVPVPVQQARPATPPALATLVMRCLEKSPADRPQAASELIQTLDALATPSGTLPSSVTERAGAASSVGHPAPVRTPGTRRAVVLWTSGAVLALAAVGGWFAGTRPREVVPRAQLIAVAPFANETGEPQFDVLGRYTADVLTRELSRDDTLVVLSATAVQAALSNAPRDVDVASYLANATNSSVIVHGSIYLQGDSLRLQATITRAAGGTMPRAIDPVVGVRTAASEAVDVLRDRVLGAFAIDGNWVMTRAPKIEAYLEFSEGLAFFGVDYPRARRHLHRAIAIDSTLFAAYVTLATAYANVAMWDSSAAVVSLFGRFQNRLSADERDWLAMNRGILAGDIEAELVAARRLMKRDPRGLPAYLTGLYALWSLRHGEALRALLEVDSMSLARRWPLGFQTSVLAGTYHLGSDYAHELAMLLDRRRAYPDDRRLLASHMMPLAGLGQGAWGAALADSLLRGTAGLDRVVHSVQAGALEFDAHGDSVTARQIAGQVTRWYAAQRGGRPDAFHRVTLGSALLVQGLVDSALQVFSRTGPTEPEPSSAPLLTLAGYRGLALARKGDRAGAMAVADSLGALTRPWLFGNHTFWRAAIMAELGDREAAMTGLAEAYKQGVPKSLWHASYPLRALRGYPPFEVALRPVQ
ncbi:MAG: protein kinase [Gemmatimonadaceae bacterium]|nr:protein kinase [Gemmatimonadaceae bacterium]